MTQKKTCIELGKDYAYKTASNRAGTRLIAISSANLILRLWDLEKQKEITALNKTTHPLIGFTSVVWGPQEATPLLVSTRNNGTIQLWNVKDNEQNLAKAWQAHKNTINYVRFSPNGQHVATASDDSTIKIWDLRKTKEPVTTLEDHQEGVMEI